MTLDKRRFTPEDRGRLVTTFLKNSSKNMSITILQPILKTNWMPFPAGKFSGRKALRQFWGGFKTAIDGTKDLTITLVLDALDEERPSLFPPVSEENPDPANAPRVKPDDYL